MSEEDQHRGRGRMRETKREERAKKKKNKGYHIILEEGKKGRLGGGGLGVG